MNTPNLHHAALLAAVIALAACGKSPEAAKPAVPEAPKPAVMSDSKVEAAILDALTPAAPPAPAPMTAAEVDEEVLAILAENPGKNATELLNVPVVNQKLASILAKLGQDKALQARINSTVDLAAQFTGLDGPPGSARLDLDITKYDQARTARMLQAVLSEDPGQLVGFLVGEIGEATPDISYGGMSRAPNGVSIVPNAPPAAPPVKTDSPE